jgi:hypothetical protein
VDYGNITQAHGDSLIPQKYFEQFMKKKKRRVDEQVYIQKNRCELKLVADYEFFRVIGHGNYAQSARYLVSYYGQNARKWTCNQGWQVIE